ncbi:MAG TPA: hypothetical protein VED67_01885 [Thermodesulfovibrionales bacterium]|nr:hypothetical protein [Thermodesulfovibrionales bacterium]
MTEKDILSKVIAVEKEIQDKLMLEKERSLEWLEKVKREAEEAVSREEERLKGSFESAKMNSGTDAEKKATQMLKKADAEAERISGISDETVGRILMRHVAFLLPSDALAKKPERPPGSSA